MQAELSLIFTIADTLTEVKHALVLSNVLNLVLNVTKFMQADLKVVEEVGH